MDEIAMADRMPPNEELESGVLMLETSEELPSADRVRWWIRALGERGTLAAVSAVLVSRTPATAIGSPSASADERKAWRAAQRDVVVDEVSAYNPEAVVCVGPPFGHVRPQWILPYGGEVTVDGVNQRIVASY